MSYHLFLQAYDVTNYFPNSPVSVLPTQSITTQGNRTEYCFALCKKSMLREQRLIVWDEKEVTLQMTEFDPLGQVMTYRYHMIPYEQPEQFQSHAFYRSNGKLRKWGNWQQEDRFTKEIINHKGQIAENVHDIMIPANGIHINDPSNIIAGLTEQQKPIAALLNSNQEMLLLDFMNAVRPAVIVALNPVEEAVSDKNELKLMMA